MIKIIITVKLTKIVIAKISDNNGNSSGWSSKNKSSLKGWKK